ncbi:endonuclease V [Candidatus Woesearchaeota archaeon]|nr:endonuclease V [Candidatus Woesearchaeota archaeon]
MDTFELTQEQKKLAYKIILRDSFDRIETIGGITCVSAGKNILATVVVLNLKTLELQEKQSFLLENPLPYRLGFEGFREVPAMIEAVNLLEVEPEVLIVSGDGIIHPRGLGLASHLGLSLNIPTIGIAEKLMCGTVENGKVFVDKEIKGFEVTTKEFAKPVYVSPGHLISLGSSLDLIRKVIRLPHKMPEPLHIAQRVAKKKVEGLRNCT